ncbi:MAG: hypothetical protein A2Y40_07830 [Candidatus Margulisbacteria bacterium GWF2_35_9]|nr:MAG: hypothetical protein A2Y40_07830 [Candidatus Margulisbacteria bacterium GWF2_35_9]
MGGANIALILNGEALFVNPAFLVNQGFGFGKQFLDTGNLDYTNYQMEYLTIGSTGFGSVKYTEKNTGNSYDIQVAGFGAQMSERIKWGMIVEHINLNDGAVSSQIWTTKVGVSFIMSPPSKMFWGITLDHFFKEKSSQTAIDVSPHVLFSLGWIPMEKLLWTHSLEYTRKAGEGIYYATGMALLLDHNLVLSGGINRNGYSAGIEIPITFGKINYTIIMPYDINKEIKYCLSYSYGGL